MLSRPRHLLRRAQREQQVELFREEVVVVVEVVAEERKRFDERSASGHHLRPSSRKEVERRERLEDAHGIVRAEDGHRARQTDRLRARGDGGQDDGRRGRGEVGPVVLADAVDVEPELVGELRFLEQIA
jgi:hypothetical protein